jgi:T5SS/PEP-CTERM-associated repeat protein
MANSRDRSFRLLQCLRWLTAIVGALLLGTSRINAADYFWISQTDAGFSTASAWNPSTNAPPAAADMAIFDRYGLSGFDEETTVSFSTSPSNSRLIVRDDAIALNLAANTYRLTNASAGTASLVVAEQAGHISNLRIEGGRLEAVNATLGLASQSDGVVNVSGANWSNSQTLLVGSSGVGEIILDTGAQVTAARITLGAQADSLGIVTAEDVDTTLSSSQQLVIGGAGEGNLYIYDDASVSSVGAVIARDAGSRGIVSLSGGNWHNTGNLDISGSTTAAGGTGDLVIDYDSTVTVTGRTRIWNNGLLSIRGGTLQTGSLENLGGIEYLVGVLHLTSSDLVIGDTGVLGSVLALTPDMHTIVEQHTTVNANGHIAAVEGSFTTGSITNNGRLSIVTGAMDFRNASTNATTGRISIIDGTLATGTGAAKRLTNQGKLDLLDAVVNGDLHNAAGTTVTIGGAVAFNGRVTGDGQFSGGGSVTFNGRFEPGDAATALEFGGDVSFTAANSLLMQIGGTTAGAQFDQIDVEGSVAFNGALNVVLLNGFLPSAGQSFPLIEYSARAGTFSTMNLPTLPNSLTWAVNYGASALTLSVNSSSLPGDLNLDGAVNRADLALLVGNYGLTTGATSVQGDMNSDGRVALADLMLLRSMMTSPGGSPDAVPEPATCLLCCVGIAAMAFVRGRRR